MSDLEYFRIKLESYLLDGIKILVAGWICHMVATRLQGGAHVCTFIQSRYALLLLVACYMLMCYVCFVCYMLYVTRLQCLKGELMHIYTIAIALILVACYMQ